MSKILRIDAATPKICIYCGGPVGNIGRGEHIIQNALGCKKTIKNVCSRCNQGFSTIDKELVSRSHLALIASQELQDAQLLHCWDINHQNDNVLLEARPNWKSESFELYPQLIFEQNEVCYYGDTKHAAPYGKYYNEWLVKAAMLAYRRFHQREKTTRFELIELGKTRYDTGYRYPPRAYFPYSVDEFMSRCLERRKPPTCIVRFLDDADKRHALNSLSNLQSDIEFGPREAFRGSYTPAVQFAYNLDDTLQAMLKNAVNLLSFCCQQTKINRDTLPNVIRQITGELPILQADLDKSGFVYAEDVAKIATPDAHDFRIAYANGIWTVLSSYFGGRIGSIVRFDGPSNETWRFVDITAPIRSPEWRIAPSTLSVDVDARITNEGHKIVPSVPMLGQRTKIVVSAYPFGRRHRTTSSRSPMENE